MISFTGDQIRSSFVNISVRERKELALPPTLADLRWDRLDYLGWRDPRIPQLGYVVVEVSGAPVGILLRQAEGRITARAQCTWCEDVTLPNDVVAFNAKRTGAAGRNGNTVGTLVCANFECSTNVRKLPPVAYLGFDVEAARERRIESLREHSRNFVLNVRDGSGG